MTEPKCPVCGGTGLVWNFPASDDTSGSNNWRVCGACCRRPNPLALGSVTSNNEVSQ